MMKKFEAVVTAIGDMVEEFIEQKMIILFDESAPQELREISVVHRGRKLMEDVVPGDVLYLGRVSFKVTAVGDVANKNLAKIGHVCLKFDGKTTPELPGNIHLEEKQIPMPKVGEEILIQGY